MRDGTDIHSDVEVSYLDAILGTQAQVGWGGTPEQGVGRASVAVGVLHLPQLVSTLPLRPGHVAWRGAGDVNLPAAHVGRALSATPARTTHAHAATAITLVGVPSLDIPLSCRRTPSAYQTCHPSHCPDPCSESPLNPPPPPSPPAALR